jgi:hypothetical protein
LKVYLKTCSQKKYRDNRNIGPSKYRILLSIFLINYLIDDIDYRLSHGLSTFTDRFKTCEQYIIIYLLLLCGDVVDAADDELLLSAVALVCKVVVVVVVVVCIAAAAAAAQFPLFLDAAVLLHVALGGRTSAAVAVVGERTVSTASLLFLLASLLDARSEETKCNY